MSHPREVIKNYDLSQLQSLDEFVKGLIAAKKNQAKRTVWRVCDSFGLVHENFREEDYQKAADFVSLVAKEMDGKPDFSPREKEIRLIGERVPESEYEDFFNG